MQKYNVRSRQVIVFDAEIEAMTYKEAFLKFQQKLEKKHFISKCDVVRLNYEIESVTHGDKNDSKVKNCSASHKKTRGPYSS